jgi:hypothetical protein
MAEKKEIEKQISEHERIVELIGCWLSFPSKPWWSWVESHRIGGLARALGVLQDPPSSPVAGIATTMMVGHPCGLRGCEAPAQEGPPLVFLVSVLLVCAWCCSSVHTATISLVPVLTGVIPHQL